MSASVQTLISVQLKLFMDHLSSYQMTDTASYENCLLEVSLFLVSVFLIKK
jgi:hypothetical protein